MTKIAVVTDSNSGISIERAKSMGIYLVPMPFTIDDKEYFEGINLSRDQFYEHLKNGADIHTSQPTPQAVMDIWDKLLNEYDEIVHIPMSSGLSGSCQTAKSLAEDYDGKVAVVNNQRISCTQIDSIKDALYLIEQGKNCQEIMEILEKEALNSSIYITLDTIYYLKKGGRITPAAAAVGTLLKIKPVLQIQGEKLDAFSKARTMQSAKQTMINAIKADIEGRLSENGKYKVQLNTAHTNNYEACKEFADELAELFPDCGEIGVEDLSLSVACHIGPGSFAVGASRILR